MDASIYVYTYIPNISSASLILNILFLKNQLIILEDRE